MIGRRRYAPAQEPSCLCNHDASALSTLWQDTGRTTAVTTAGQFVALVDDRTAYGRAQKQSAAGQRPTYVVTSGIPGLSFDGVDDFMQTDLFSWGTGLGHEFWIVFTPASNGTGIKIIAAQQQTTYTETNATMLYSYRASGSPPQIWSYRSSLLRDKGGGVLGAGTRRVTRFSLDNAPFPDVMINWLDGVAGTSNLTPNNTDSTATNRSSRLRLGSSASFPWDGVIHEAWAFSQALDATTANRVQAYAKAKWGTP